MVSVRVLILRVSGTNCDLETQFAFEQVGAYADRVHLNRICENPAILDQYQIFVVPGGFSYGDDVAAGKILALQLTHHLGNALHKFRARGNLILGICNGFQVLLKAGLILPPDEDGAVATLALNESGHFQSQWTRLVARPEKCPFLTGLSELELPIAHAEGRFVARQPWILRGLEQTGQVVLRYADNPTGSEGAVAGLCDVTGHVLGLMPHPERYILPTQHPRWTRCGPVAEPDGLRLFRNAVTYFVE
jgi:phosphoribosylformylglycinamidine synthase